MDKHLQANNDLKRKEPHVLPVLSDMQLNKQLHECGYVVLDVFEDAQLSTLRQLFKQYQQEMEMPFYTSIQQFAPALRRTVSGLLERIMFPQLSACFASTQVLMPPSFIVKRNRTGSEINWHQDWSIVDEEQFRAYNVWTPLQHVDEENGFIRVLPYSHLYIDDIRGLHIPRSFEDINDALTAQSIGLPMRAGQVLVYDYRLLHSSPPNQSASDRVAIIFGVKRKEAQMMLYRYENGMIKRYPTSIDFYLDGNTMSPELPFAADKSMEYAMKKLDMNDWKQIQSLYYST
jgi:ectoine hydroxylase-related dioxygenase (phytanoyl-CoA dioxygenase family)